MSKQHRAFMTDMLANIPQVEQIARQHTSDQQRKATEKERQLRARLTPLDDRLRRVLDNIPDSIKAEGIRLPPLVHQLAGRIRQHPSAGDVGKALRRLGWRRKRDWSNGDEGYPAVWYPPNNNE